MCSRAELAGATHTFLDWRPRKPREVNFAQARTARMRRTQDKSAPLRTLRDASSCDSTFPFSHRYRRAQLLGQNAAHHLIERLARFFQHEGVFFVGPAEFETGGQRGDPYLAHRRIRADDEARFVVVLELNFNLAAAALHFESALVADFEESFLETLESYFAFLLKFALVHHKFCDEVLVLMGQFEF